MVVTSLPMIAGVGTVRGAPPGGRPSGHVGAGQVGWAFQQPIEVGLEVVQALQLDVDLGQPLAQQRLGVPTGTLALVGNLEQLADLAQAQAGSLGPLDQAQPVDGGGVIEPVAGRRPGGLGEEADPFVVADRVGAEADGVGEGGDGECHAQTIDLGAHSKVKWE